MSLVLFKDGSQGVVRTLLPETVPNLRSVYVPADLIVNLPDLSKIQNFYIKIIETKQLSKSYSIFERSGLTSSPLTTFCKIVSYATAYKNTLLESRTKSPIPYHLTHLAINSAYLKEKFDDELVKRLSFSDENNISASFHEVGYTIYWYIRLIEFLKSWSPTSIATLEKSDQPRNVGELVANKIDLLFGLDVLETNPDSEGSGALQEYMVKKTAIFTYDIVRNETNTYITLSKDEIDVLKQQVDKDTSRYDSFRKKKKIVEVKRDKIDMTLSSSSSQDPAWVVSHEKKLLLLETNKILSLETYTDIPAGMVLLKLEKGKVLRATSLVEKTKIFTSKFPEGQDLDKYLNVYFEGKLPVCREDIIFPSSYNPYVFTSKQHVSNRLTEWLSTSSLFTAMRIQSPFFMVTSQYFSFSATALTEPIQMNIDETRAFVRPFKMLTNIDMGLFSDESNHKMMKTAVMTVDQISKYAKERANVLRKSILKSENWTVAQLERTAFKKLTLFLIENMSTELQLRISKSDKQTYNVKLLRALSAQASKVGVSRNIDDSKRNQLISSDEKEAAVFYFFKQKTRKVLATRGICYLLFLISKIYSEDKMTWESVLTSDTYTKDFLENLGSDIVVKNTNDDTLGNVVWIIASLKVVLSVASDNMLRRFIHTLSNELIMKERENSASLSGSALSYEEKNIKQYLNSF